MTLDLPKGPLSFHSADFRRVGVSGVSAETTPELESCTQWAGRKVKVWFRFVADADKEYSGEIIRVHFE